MGKLKHKIKIEWSSNFAYAIGLIASDGWLHKNGNKIGLSSKELEMIENFRSALHIDNAITKYARGGETEKRYFMVNFGDKIFHQFLNTIGLKPAKSKIIKFVNVPDQYFADFLRGLFDGDGSFYSCWDKRWPNSFVYQIMFYSASEDFILWLKDRLTLLYNVKGYVKNHRSAGVHGLHYVKRDTRILVDFMYKDALLYLKRKRDKINVAIDLDKENKLPLLPVQNIFQLVKIMPR